MTDKSIHRTSFRYRFEVRFDGKKLSDKLGFNNLVLTPMTVFESGKQDEIEAAKIFCKIITIDGTRVVFEKPKSRRVELREKYHVSLAENRVPSRLAFKALERIKKLQLEEFFTTFDTSTLCKQPAAKKIDEVETIECCNPSISENGSQTTAVMHIINRSSFPTPYIVFGPPGTGKTSTLVEAIAQIVKLQPNAKVLVTANSNAACDEIGERLLKFMPRYKMYRLYSPSFDISYPDRHMRLNAAMKPISNIKHDINQYSSYEEFYSYNVIISTLVTCGRMITANIAPSHFDYIFIDECASTIEPYAVIPIASLGASLGRVDAQVVLAGDHKQLQGLVHTYFNEKHGFGISLMERVMQLDEYQFPYNPRLVTQLTDNFRSHWAILRFSNYHFYHSVLKARQTKEVADFAIGWSLLPNKKFPLIFHSILAPSEVDGTSLFNDEEVHVVGQYVTALLKRGIEGKKVEAVDIGIICPYGAQRKRFTEKFKDVKELEVGTVDSFQGREKLIIIMSTVRSQTETVGFLKNEKRLNVALTRAKALLIVVGNGETLQKNKLWYKFINYCYQQGAMVGERFMLRYRKEVDAGKVAKPHPMFQRPKVAAAAFGQKKYQQRLPAYYTVTESSEMTSSEVSDDECDWLSENSAMLFDSDNDSDTSWTHEDHRMKAKTSQLNKWKDTNSPGATVDMNQNTQKLTDAAVMEEKFKVLKLKNGACEKDSNNNAEIDSLVMLSLAERFNSIMSLK